MILLWMIKRDSACTQIVEPSDRGPWGMKNGLRDFMEISFVIQAPLRYMLHGKEKLPTQVKYWVTQFLN